MTKLFYTDPLEAAFMAREYGVNCYCFDALLNTQLHYADDDYIRHCDIILESYQDGDEVGKYYIHPDSLSIFEPQEGDVFFNCPKDKRRKIIQRDGKAFFMPERENEDD